MYLWFQSHLLAAVGVMPDNDHNEKNYLPLSPGERSPFSKRERKTNPSDL